jgi:hypothetical protein
MSYKIDISGDRDQVKKELEELTYEAMVEKATERHTLATLRLKSERPGDPRLLEEQKVASLHLRLLSAPGERDCFERAKKYALEEITGTRSKKVGVSIHASDHRQGMEGTIQVGVAGYDWTGESPVDLDHNDFV